MDLQRKYSVYQLKVKIKNKKKKKKKRRGLQFEIFQVIHWHIIRHGGVRGKFR